MQCPRDHDEEKCVEARGEPNRWTRPRSVIVVAGSWATPGLPLFGEWHLHLVAITPAEAQTVYKGTVPIVFSQTVRQSTPLSTSLFFSTLYKDAQVIT